MAVKTLRLNVNFNLRFAWKNNSIIHTIFLSKLITIMVHCTSWPKYRFSTIHCCFFGQRPWFHAPHAVLYISVHKKEWKVFHCTSRSTRMTTPGRRWAAPASTAATARSGFCDSVCGNLMMILWFCAGEDLLRQGRGAEAARWGAARRQAEDDAQRQAETGRDVPRIFWKVTHNAL